MFEIGQDGESARESAKMMYFNFTFGSLAKSSRFSSRESGEDRTQPESHQEISAKVHRV
ncbi:hypothetical protein DSM3645_29511 [Blastopirellula marina DSM 3645]|uniref:Uncharacterized protein n=1 Tax=Blastopirellula marina DSM 3645 TaxID=314230 RepID=A4A1U0_9BACT|nr:hypothetical protein DSM3645_29511 [Blastopirellula marina DSM 3645]